eukprot:3567943-Amphidinium_carterae.1
MQRKVLEKQATIIYGADDDGVVPQVEVDEVAIARFPNKGHPTHPVTWASYVGFVARGRPESLRLVKLPLRSTVARAPRPGPI